MIQVVIVTVRSEEFGAHALKVACTMDDAGPNEIQSFKAQCSGIYRVLYGEWGKSPTAEVKLVKKF